MVKVEYSPKALDDLLHIRDYITENWGEKVAKEKLRKITIDIKRLEQFPLSGVNLGKIIDVTTDYFYLFTERNYAFYYLEKDKIRIIRVLNENQDYIMHLFGSSVEDKY